MPDGITRSVRGVVWIALACLALPVAHADGNTVMQGDTSQPTSEASKAVPATPKESSASLGQQKSEDAVQAPAPSEPSTPDQTNEKPVTQPDAVSKPASQGIGIGEAAQKAINTNPEVQAQWHSLREATEAQDAAWGGFLPKIDLGASRAREEREYRGGQQPDTVFQRSDVNLTLTQMIYDGFATHSRFVSLAHSRRASYYDLLNTTEQISLEAYTAYEDVRRYRELLGLAQENLDKHKDVFKLIAERVKAGVGRSVDLEQVTGRLALAKSNVLTEESNLHDVYARYRRITGEYPPESMAPIKLDAVKVPPTRDEVRKQAFNANPALLASVERVLAAGKDVEVQEASLHPRFDLRLRGDYGKDLNQVSGDSSVYVAEVLMNYNLFNGGSDMAAIGQSTERLYSVRELKEKTCREVLQTADIAFNDVSKLSEQLTYLDQHQLAIAKAREAYRDQFDIGQRSLLDLLDTENEYFDSRRAYINGLYDRSIAHARTLAAMGNLMSRLAVKRADFVAVPDMGDKPDGPADASYCQKS